MGRQFEEYVLRCIACGRDFIWSVQDQRYAELKGFLPPRRCEPCRAARRHQRAIDETMPTRER